MGRYRLGEGRLGVGVGRVEEGHHRPAGHVEGERTEEDLQFTRIIVFIHNFSSVEFCSAFSSGEK